MYERILNQLREKVRTRQYVMTLHADEEMDEDELSIFDVESVILSGKIIERQKDQARVQANGSILSKANRWLAKASSL